MEDEKLVAILWMIAAVSVVCFFAALVSQHRDDQQWSHVVPAPAATTPVRVPMGGK